MYLCTRFKKNVQGKKVHNNEEYIQILINHTPDVIIKSKIFKISVILETWTSRKSACILVVVNNFFSDINTSEKSISTLRVQGENDGSHRFYIF